MPQTPQPSQEDELRPVIYELGKALYVAQQFETNLLFLVALLSAQDGSVTSTTFKTGLNRRKSERTLGGLWGTFRKQLALSGEHEADFVQFMESGVDVRNKVVHGYVMRNTTLFRTRAGREKMVEELQAVQHELNDRLQFSAKALDRALQIFGGSLEKIRAEAEFEFEADLLNEVIRH